MPQPGFREGHIDVRLTNASIQYKNLDYIADRVCPVVPVQKQSDIILTYNKGDFFRDTMTPRTPGTLAARDGYNISDSLKYFAVEWEIAKDITEEEMQNFDSPLSAELDGAIFLAEKAAIRYENLVAANIFATSKWTNTDQTGVSAGPAANQFVQWSNPGASDPFNDISVSAETIRASTGIPKSRLTLIIGAVVWAKLQNHPDLIDRAKYTLTGMREIATPELLASTLGIREVLVGNAINNTAAEGATAVMADIWGKAALLYYRVDAPMLRTPAACLSFGWNVNGKSWRNIYRYDKLAWEQRCISLVQSLYVDPAVITAGDAGVFFTSAIA